MVQQRQGPYVRACMHVLMHARARHRAGGFKHPNGVWAAASYRKGMTLDPKAAEKIDAVMQSLAVQKELGTAPPSAHESELYLPRLPPCA